MLPTVFAAIVLCAQPGDHPEHAGESPAQAETGGIQPLPDYSGDAAHRAFLAGDPGGRRSSLASAGLVLDLDALQTIQSVVRGGRRIDSDFGSSFNFTASADLQRMGVMRGALLRLRAESRTGESVNDDTGAILPVHTEGLFPLTDRANESIPFTITELTCTQFFSQSVGVFLGKLQTLDGDPNEFAGGRGRSQFMDAHFNLNAAGALTVPYSTLGGGVIVIPSPGVTLVTTLMNRLDSSTTSGLENLGNGWTWATEADFQYCLGSLPGGSNAGVGYSFAGDFADLGGTLRFVPGGVVLPRESESWYLYASTWQYLHTADAAPAHINTVDGRADLRGIGLFARVGYADPDTNPIHWTASVGIGARGMLFGREEDTLGIGYVYGDLQDEPIFDVLQIKDTGQAVEAFYSIALTPAAAITLDAEWVDGGSRSIDAATVVGARLRVRF